MQYERFELEKEGVQKQVFLVDMKEDRHSGIFSSLAEKTLETYIPTGKKILILGGKKGVAAGVQCQDCGFIPKCQHCDIPIAYHRDEAGHMFGICHICKTSYPALEVCPDCQGYTIDYFGVGLQKIAEVLHEKYPKLATLQIDGDNVSSLPKITDIQHKLSSAQCVIATSILQVAPVRWKPDYVILLRADSSLSVPDWKVTQHCYEMISSVISQYNCPTIVQAYTPEHYAIRCACAGDEKLFWEQENEYRKQYEYPPFGELAIVLYKHEIEQTMYTRVNKLYQELLFLQKTLGFTGEIFATPPMIYKMYNKYRYNIIIKGNDVHTFLEKAFVELKIRDRGFKIDWLPESIV